MAVYVDYPQVQTGNVATEHTDATSITIEGCIVPVLLPESTCTALLAAYDSTDASSPSEAVSREIARAVLDALVRHTTT